MAKSKLNNTRGAGLAVAVHDLYHECDGVLLVLVPDFVTALRLERELSFFAVPLVHFPDWETLPYDSFSPHQDLISQRLSVLQQLPGFKRGVLIIPIATLMHRICPEDFVSQSAFVLDKGDEVDLPQVRQRLERAGYVCTAQVMEHGEFSVRGSILDVYPMGSNVPYRIDLFDNEVDTIREFDTETQRSTNTLEAIKLLPAREYPFTEEAIAEFRTRWRDRFSGDPRNCSVYQDVSQGYKAAGLEYYLPLFFDKTATLFDYLPDNISVLQVGDIEGAGQEFWRLVQERYEQYGHDVTRPILKPTELFVPIAEIFADCNKYSQLLAELLEPSDLPDIHELEQYVQQTEKKILFVAESSGRKVILEELLAQRGLHPLSVDDWNECLESDQRFLLTIAALEAGAVLDDIVILTETELLGRKLVQQRRRKTKAIDPSAAIRNLAELTIGSPVVHLEYGVGRYLGLTSLELGGQQGEFVTLEYANEDKIYLPVSALHLISRYSGVDLEHAPLHSLGSDKWAKSKRKAAQQIRDVAAELLQVYAHRAAKEGHAFASPDSNYYEFASSFPFEETADQQMAIEQVIKDLTAPHPMDRVVCGDVGFGKTEVAMRAAFIAAAAGKQVAVLVPTTLLAQQHYQTFSDRFANFPLQVMVMSRFNTNVEQQQVLDSLATGKCDIVIGTHRLLQKDVKIKDLGLLVIDEEHRFGVRQKERFKSLRAQVDILTLTATPIPRTLNMAMSGVRDLSIIGTPPAKRLSVKTFVRERSKPLIQEAVNRELSRGGQVYFLHNQIETIETTAAELEEWLPNARISVAHGQMSERDLERIMSDFYHRRFNVLVCTTIIETGIDVPSANTIIMDRADKLGLAQLHQLRGRVGRSHHQAYAFCLTPPPAAISKDANKRLEAIESLDTLGAGFSLSTHDLEIRGAGELLGEDQSGNLQTIGFSLFMELLEHTVEKLQAGEKPNLDLSLDTGPDIDLQLPAFIPDNYLGDVQLRLLLYKRIASAKTLSDLDEIRVEMIDRFGELPDQVKNLFVVTDIKLLAASIGVKSLKTGRTNGKLEFTAQPKIDPDKIVKLIQGQPTKYSFAGPTSIKFRLDLATEQSKIDSIRELIQGLLPT